MNDKERDLFYNDLCNIARVLPYVPSKMITTKLNAVKDNPNRVQIILQNLFSSYVPENHDPFTDDITNIKNVIPEWLNIKISNELKKFQNEPNRVQLVLKKYFQNKNISFKRSYHNDYDSAQEKKIKINNEPEKFEIVELEDEKSEEYDIVAEVIQINLSQDTIKTESDDENLHEKNVKFGSSLSLKSSLPVSIEKLEDYGIPNTEVKTEDDTEIKIQYIKEEEKDTAEELQAIKVDELSIKEEEQNTAEELRTIQGSELSIKEDEGIKEQTLLNIFSEIYPRLPLDDFLDVCCSVECTPYDNATTENTSAVKIALEKFFLKSPTLTNIFKMEQVSNIGEEYEKYDCKTFATERVPNSGNTTSDNFSSDIVKRVEKSRLPCRRINNNYEPVASTSKTNDEFIKLVSCKTFAAERVPNSGNTTSGNFSSDIVKKMEKSRLPCRRINNNYEPVASTSKMSDEFINLLKIKAQTVSLESCIDLTKTDENLNYPSTSDMIKDESFNQPSTSLSDATKHPFYFKLLEIFPDICPSYLREFCSNRTEFEKIDDLINELLNKNYRKRVVIYPLKEETKNLNFDEQLKILYDLFPNADPTYLQHHCERLIDQPKDFKDFVATLVERRNYPTKEEYLKKKKLSAQEKQYTTEFNIKKFLEVIPDPETFFKNPKRQVSFDNFDDTNYAITFLKNHFTQTTVKDILRSFRMANFSVINAANILENIRSMKTKRKLYTVTSCTNIPLLQEIAYVTHKNKILDFIKCQKLEKQKAREKARAEGLLRTCLCCYDDEVMPDETVSCESGKHEFCKMCVRKGCEVVIGEGKLQFACFQNCESFFTLHVLQAVLDPKVFSKMVKRKQIEEVKSADIEDLEFCPFCDFAIIPAPNDKIFRCLNPDCMKETCRLCKEPSHIPLRCEEVEKDTEVKIRTYIEDKMTEALLRKCYKCGMKFVKESGCNKMTCHCGAMMCYICKKPVKDYTHFNGPGGDQHHLCLLYSDTNILHLEAVEKSAEEAKQELGVEGRDLKIDPTVNLKEYF